MYFNYTFDIMDAISGLSFKADIVWSKYLTSSKRFGSSKRRIIKVSFSKEDIEYKR